MPALPAGSPRDRQKQPSSSFKSLTADRSLRMIAIMKPWHATLALGGGGARGVAHLGAIEELLAAGLAVERIVGVSIGSLAGAIFAFEPDIARVQKRTLDFLRPPGFAQAPERALGAHPAVAVGGGGGV